MAFKKKNYYEIFGAALVLSALLSTASAFDCLGKSFHCVNSSHFMICIDVGGGVSQSIDDFTIPCPPPTVCQGNNHFECEFPITTTPSTTLSNVLSESTIPWEEVDVTTVSPPQNTTKEYSEKYMNTESLTSLSANSYTTDATVDYTTEAASLIDSVNITETRTVVTEILLYDTTTSKDDISQTITEHNVASAGELLSETANNYTSIKELTDNVGLVSTSTEKAVPSKLNNTEATSLIDDISITETGPAVTEAFPYDTTTNQHVITQTITEHNAGKLLTETANNYTLDQELTTNEGLVSTSTIKTIPSKFNATEATSIIYDISIAETGPAVSKALPDDTTTIQNVITRTITEDNVASAGELLTENANNYSIVQQVTDDVGLLSTSTEKAVPSKLNNTVAASLVHGISITETGYAVTEALPYDTTTNLDVIPQSITEHNKESAGELMSETAINYTQGQEVTNNAGLVSTSTEKAVPLQLNTTEAALLIDAITSPATTEALPYDTTTSKDAIRETKTEHNVASAGASLTETANNYTLQLEVTNNAGLVSTSTEKAVPSKLNTAEAASLMDDISKTDINPAVTEALPYYTTTSQDIVTQVITERNVASAGEPLTETANNYTLVQEVTNNAGLVSTSTEKAVPLPLNTTETALLFDDISITKTSPVITEALPYYTTTSKDVIRETITEHNVASAGESLTETANNYTLQLEVTNNAGLVSTSTEKAVPVQLNTTETALLIDDINITKTSPAITEALPYDSTTSNDVITQTITDHIVAAAGGLLTESANTLVQQITTEENLVSPSTETTKVDIRKTINVTRESAFNQVKTTSESIPTEISVVNGLPTTTDNVFVTDANLINTDLRASNTNMLDSSPTIESAAATTVDGIIVVVNLFTTEQPAVENLLQTTQITNSLNYATTTTSESTTLENVVFNKRNLTVFGKDAATDTNANSVIEISLGQEQNITNNQPLSTKNISSKSSPTEQKLVDLFNNSISTDVSSILTTETVYLITNDTLSTNEEVLDQSKQTSDSMVTEASVDTELPAKGYVIIPDVSTVPSVDLVQNTDNQSMFNYVTPNATTMVEEKVRTERPNITLFEENIVTEVTTNFITESPLLLNQSLTDNAPVNQIPIDNTGLGSSSTEPAVIPILVTGHNINRDNFARGTEIVTTGETKYNVLDQATLGPETIVAVTALPTSIDDNFTTKTNVTKNNEVPSAENKLLNTKMSNQTITTKTVILQNNFGVKQQNFTTNNGHITEAPPRIFATNTNDNILNPNIVKQAASTSNIDIEENLATPVNDNLIKHQAKKKPTDSVKNLGNSPKHTDFVEYNTEHPKLTDYIKASSSDTENKINSSLSGNLGKSTEKSAVQHNVSTEQLTIKEIQGSITKDTALETGQAKLEVKNTQKQISVKGAASVLSSAQQIFDKTSDRDVETGTLLEDAFDNNSHTKPSVTKQISKVEVADNIYLDLTADGITEESNLFIHGDTTSAPFIVTTAQAAGVESYNKIGDQVSTTKVILDVHKNMAHAKTIRPTDVIYNTLNPISNIIFNTNVNWSDGNIVETTTGANIALTFEIGQEKNLNPIGNQAKEYIQKVVDSFGMTENTTENNLKESETSSHATVATEKPNFGVLPINTKSDDPGKTTTLSSHVINPELINHKDLFIAEETKQLNTNLAPITSINDKNETMLNNDQFNYLTDSSLNDNTNNKIDLDNHIAVKAEDHTSTNNVTNANENKNDLQGIIINTTDNTILRVQEGSTNYLSSTFKTDVLESEKVNDFNTLQSGPNVQDPQYHNPPTETYIGIDVDNYPKLTIMEESISHVYKFSQIPSQNNYFTTTRSIVTNDANIITEKSTSTIGVDLNEVSEVNNNIYLPRLDTNAKRPAIPSVITDKQKSHFNTGNQDDDSLKIKGSTKFATADVNVASKQIGNQAIDLPEKTIGHTETTTVYIRDANQNKIDGPPSVLQTRNSAPKFPQLNDVKNVHQPIDNVFDTASETSSQHAFTDVYYNVAQSKSIVQEPAQTTQENTNTKAKASKAWDGISNNMTGKTLESFLTRQNTTINLPTEITTDSFSEPYPATSTSRTINAPKPANEAQGINNVLVTGKPMIPVVRNTSTDNPLTQPQVVKEIRADVNQINTSSSVIANAEQSNVNVSRKIGTITKTLLSQNHTNATKEVAKTQLNATSSHKVVNTINSTTQASVKRVPLRPESSVTENPTKQVLSSPQFKYNCINGTRGRYSDKNDCRKFYICVGNNRPIVGTCPGNTVFSDIKKLCTRNMSHCIRENQFKCPLAGRFSDLINDVYYICVNHKNSLYRFKFQCQKGFTLNKTITRCMDDKVIVPNDSASIPSSDGSESSTASTTSKSSSTSSIRSGSRGDSDSSNSSQSKKSVEKKEEELEKPDNKEEDESEEIFLCRQEGKFPIRNECRRYYLCKKNGKSKYRRKIKKCGSGDVFHKSKKRCVDAESYEC